MIIFRKYDYAASPVRFPANFIAEISIKCGGWPATKSHCSDAGMASRLSVGRPTRRIENIDILATFRPGKHGKTHRRGPPSRHRRPYQPGKAAALGLTPAGSRREGEWLTGRISSPSGNRR